MVLTISARIRSRHAFSGVAPLRHAGASLCLVSLMLLASAGAFASPKLGRAVPLASDHSTTVANSFEITVTIASYAVFATRAATQDVVDLAIYPNKGGGSPSEATARCQIALGCNVPVTVSVIQDLGAALNDPAHGGLPYHRMLNYPGYVGGLDGYVVAPGVQLYEAATAGTRRGRIQGGLRLAAGTPYAGEPAVGSVTELDSLVGAGREEPLQNLYALATCDLRCRTFADASWTQVKPGLIPFRLYATVQAR